MTTQQFIQEFEAATAKIVATVKAKNADYAGDGDPFFNFLVIEKLSKGRISAEDGILVRKTDKITRLMNLVKQDAAVTEESFEDTCLDDAAYSIILAVLRGSRCSTASTVDAGVPSTALAQGITPVDAGPSNGEAIHPRADSA